MKKIEIKETKTMSDEELNNINGGCGICFEIGAAIAGWIKRNLL